MFQDTDSAPTLSKKEDAGKIGKLRERLLDAQFRLAETDFPVIVLLAGVDGAGKGDVVNRLGQWLDIRRLRVHSFGPASEEDMARPPHWRYWRALPPKGYMAFFLSAWYHEPLLDFVRDRSDRAACARQLENVNSFEKMLTDDGTLIVKVWLHLSRDAQRRRFEEFEADPTTSWRVTETDWHNLEMCEDFDAAAEQLIATTSKDYAPWRVIPGECPRYMMHEIGSQLARAIEKHVDRRRKDDKKKPRPATKGAGKKAAKQPNVLQGIERVTPPKKPDYRTTLRRLQARLHELHREAQHARVSTVLVFEGWDASGKGSAIRRVTAALDVRRVNVVPIAAPTQEELQHHYLWRFWRQLPAGGHVTIFDRSWYGRVLVERVMGYATESEWRRAYDEITQFERQLQEAGNALAKFWLHIDPDVQEARFKARADTAYKRWKLTDEDWRNRARWSEYELAVHDMVTNTDGHAAPWTLIDANSKQHARLRVLESACEALERALNGQAAAGQPASKNGSPAKDNDDVQEKS